MSEYGSAIIVADVRTCREPTCRKPIVFATTPSGRSCPIDAACDPAGEYVIIAWGDELKPTHYILEPSKNHPDDDERYTSHYKTCVKPQQFSRKQKG